MGKIHKLYITLAAAAVVAVCLLALWISRGTGVHVKDEGTMAVTPAQIEKIKSIGQWEFLSISDEELIDTIRHGFFGDDELARIYYGTLRLGIDLNDTREGWMTTYKDTVVVTLPAVRLLDDNFIDEARTRSFIEEGKWTDADRAMLTRKAEAVMRRRCLTKANMQKAEQSARDQMERLVRNVTGKEVKVK